MTKNTQVETAQVSQATNKINVPTGKVKTIENANARKKAREEQYRNFRINSLRRRCNRMGYTEEQTEKFIKKLIEQLNAPKEYSILVMLSNKDNAMMKEALAKANIKYKYCGDTYFSIDGDQNVLAKIREIAPPSAKIYPYAKKMVSVIDERPPEKKKPTNNTAEKKAAAKAAYKKLNNKRGAHKPRLGKFVAKLKKRKTLLELKKKRKATTVQMASKKSSTGSKKASTNVKKAA